MRSEYRLGDIVDVYDYKRRPLSTMARSKMQGCIPYYSANGVIDHINKSTFHGRYILIAEDGSVRTPDGHPVIKLTDSNEDFWVSNHAHVLKASRGIDTQYLYYNLSQVNIDQCITGAVQLKVSQENLLNLKVSIHDIDDQRHIVGTIGTIDELIENLESEKEKIIELRQKIFLKFIENRPALEPFSAHAKFEGGAQPPKSKHIYESKDGYVRFIQNRDYDSDSHLTYIPVSKRNKLCTQEDIMVDKYGEAGTVRYGLSGAYNVALMKVIPINDYESEYIRDFLCQPAIRSILYASSQASTRPSLNESTFTAIKIPLAEKGELLSYERNGKNLLKLELSLNNKIQTSKRLKSALLAKYF